MRGTPLKPVIRAASARFIPAHAGNTQRTGRFPGRIAVHPRACGEHARLSSVSMPASGSSPRMRGTPARPGPDKPRNRFIPAHAGNTGLTFMAPSLRSVHPRACGEHSWASPVPIRHAGSSPRMRGTQVKSWPSLAGIRFIPAHAGNTPETENRKPEAPVHPRACGETALPGPRPRMTPVHPRACGEHAPYPVSYEEKDGSSPRMRGTRLPQGARGFLLRFIPAHAGNTAVRTTARSRSKVHPRACGEHEPGAGTWEARCGSSPRMRGTHGEALVGKIKGRFIPAHAGNTNTACSGACSPPVHPRACGEHS